MKTFLTYTYNEILLMQAYSHLLMLALAGI